MSEYGVATHWLYKEGGGKAGKDSTLDQQLAWLRQMINWQSETQDSREFLPKNASPSPHAMVNAPTIPGGKNSNR